MSNEIVKSKTKEQINQSLKRAILDGKEFDHLVAKPTNQIYDYKKGNTYIVVEIIKNFINKFFGQVAKLAPVLKGETLEKTITNVHYFLYNYFQYELDQYTQKPRTPANAWANRSEGIDCKSFTIFGGAILKNLKIKFHIRQVRQIYWKPEKFTHVYLVIPIDQEKGTLHKGYYTVDGTNKSNTEALFNKKEDTIMDELPIQGLGAYKKKPNRTKKASSARKTTTKKTTTTAKTSRNCFPFC